MILLALALSTLSAAVAGAGPRGLSGDRVPDGLTCLAAAYPEHVCEVDRDALTLCDGTRIPWDDGLDKPSFEARLENPDLQEMMAMRYQPGAHYAVPPLNFEPGRLRVAALYEAMYGRTRQEVAARLAKVRWLPRSGGRTLKMTTVNGVDRALQRVSDDIERELPRRLARLAAKTSGTFVWRTVRNSSRRSPHSFGIAIDVNVGLSDYWDWNTPDSSGRYRYKNRFPLEIVEIFERHGFVWGGKWYHFDTMHFEYRPEFLVQPCVAPAGRSDGAGASP